MSRTVTFVHAADLHLGAAFSRIDASDPAGGSAAAVVREALVAATFRALDRIVEVALERQADFLVLAGDVYNAADKGVHEQRRFRDAMRRLAESGVPVFVAHGNHDPADGWSAGFELPDSVHVFSAREVERVEVRRDGEVLAAVYGRSFPRRRVDDDYAREFLRAPEDAGRLTVGVLHTNVGGNTAHEDYAPSTTADLARAGLDYWALGHIHLPGRVLDVPRAVYAGCPQGLTPNEDDARGCYVVSWDGRSAEEEFVEIGPLRWVDRELHVEDVADVATLGDALSALCDEVRAVTGERSALLRVSLVGRGSLHEQLARAGVAADLLKVVREEQMTRAPWLWLDRLRDRTRPPLQVTAERDGFDGALVRTAESVAASPEALEVSLGMMLDEVRARLVERPDIELGPAEVLERARDLCLDLLAGGE